MKIKHQLTLVALACTVGAVCYGGLQAEAQSGPELLQQVQPNDEMLKKGEELFSQCAACHGAKGMGDGAAAAALNPKPRNFHQDKNWVNGRKFSEMYKTLEEGVKGGATGMNSYKQLPASDRVALINYIRSLAPSNYPPVSAEEMGQLQEEYNVGAALKAKKRLIPVKVAMAKLVEESKPQREKVAKAVQKLEKDQGSEAKRWKPFIYDASRALTFLNNAKNAGQASVGDFSKMVMASAEQNGFTAQVAQLTSSEWQALQSYLKSLL